MELKQYMRENLLTREQMGYKADLSKQTIYNIIKKQYTQTERTKEKIKQATNNQVIL